MGILSTRAAIFQRWQDERQRRMQEEMRTRYGAGITETSYTYEGQTYPLSIARPEGASRPLPAVFAIHGGGLAYGCYRSEWPFNLYLASQNLAVVGVEYPQADETDYAGMVKAVIAAVRTVLNQADDLGIDGAQTFLVGASAGAAIALTIGCLYGDENLAQKLLGESISDLNVAGIILNHPTVELWNLSRYHPRERGVLRRAVFEGCKDWKKAFALPYTTLAAVGKKLPDVRIITSSGDAMYGDMALDLINFMANHEIEVETDIVTDDQLDHMFNITDPDLLRSCTVNNATARFVLNRTRRED